MNVNCGHKMNMSAQSPGPASGDGLDSWKQIAVYLDREVRTVQRWEKYEGLPVHRHFHVKGGTVYAFKKEIDVWLTGRGQTLCEPRPMEKHSKHAANGSRPGPHVTRSMFAAFRLWLVIVAQESSEDCCDVGVSDTRMVVRAREKLTEIQKPQRNARARQVVTHRESRDLTPSNCTN